MTNRASLVVTNRNQTALQNLNLGSLREDIERRRNEGLYRAALPVVTEALERIFGRKTTFVRTGPLKFSNGGKTVTYKGILVRPVHGREHSVALETLDTESDVVVTTLSFSLPGAVKE